MDTMIIPRSCINSDLSATVGFVKIKIKIYLLNCQKQGNPNEW